VIGHLPELTEDLRLAQQELRARNASVVSVSGGTVRGVAHGEGLQPLLQLLDEGAVGAGCAVADRILGLAAAKLMVDAKVAAVWSPWERPGSGLVDAGRRGVGHGAAGARDPAARQARCPMEQMARTTDDVRAGLTACKAPVHAPVSVAAIRIPGLPKRPG
jgi:hypothetical protein